jgi:hypothetical protein
MDIPEGYVLVPREVYDLLVKMAKPAPLQPKEFTPLRYEPHEPDFYRNLEPWRGSVNLGG